MRTVFEILPDSFDEKNCTLLCELNNEGFSCCIKDEVENKFLGLAIYLYDKTKPPVGFPIALQIIFHQKKYLSQNFKRIKIIYSLPQSVLVPFEMYNRENSSILMNLMHGDLHQNETLLSDVIGEQSMYNCYRVLTSIYEILQQQFPAAENFHQYSLLLKEPVSSGDNLSIIFYNRKIIVALAAQGKYQLVNSFVYSAPEDVGYILLNLCKQFNIQNANLEISGLVEENSPLYRELYKFFTDVQLKNYPETIRVSDEIAKYPSHYFSYLFAIDSCE
ncbi:MAG: DUF3822 family protein [Ginsengibacter sp.]